MKMKICGTPVPEIGISIHLNLIFSKIWKHNCNSSSLWTHIRQIYIYQVEYLFMPENIEVQQLLSAASTRIEILGFDSLSEADIDFPSLIYDLLTARDNLVITILFESDSELFQTALFEGVLSSEVDSIYNIKIQKRDRIFGKSKQNSIYASLVEKVERFNGDKKILDRLKIAKFNMRISVPCIRSDNRIAFYTPTILDKKIEYIEAETGTVIYKNLALNLDSILGDNRFSEFMTSWDDELIEMYDADQIPRGVFPRSSFYTTEYFRHTIWGLVFNRKGQLLLHQRSSTTKDNRLLWDKSVGGHVDIRDTSTSISAKRELVEELFLPDAEFTKYMRAELGEIISHGDWYSRKRPEDTFSTQFKHLGKADWAMFRATDRAGSPLTHTGVSVRRLHKGDEVSEVPAMFMSDVYLFVAPEGYLDTHEQMSEMVSLAQNNGVSNSHCLKTPSELRAWISEARSKKEERETFTGDLITIDREYRYLLDEMSEFAKRL